MAKKYNYKDNFEMLYLRHEYITENKNIDGKYVKEYKHIVGTTSRLMYDKLYPNFNKVGFDLDDLNAIANVYMLGYMNNYSIKNSSEEMDKFQVKFQERKGRVPTDEEIERNERNRLINFLRQKIQHCSTVCARKARNITVGKDRRRIFAETASSISAAEESILDDYKKYGYRLVTAKEYKEALKRAKDKGEKDTFDKDGFRVFKIEMLNNGIGKEDYSSLFNDSSFKSYHRSPEEEYSFREESSALELNRKKFNNLSNQAKKKFLLKFIEQNKNHTYLRAEIKTARKMLKNIKESGIINSEGKL